MKKKDSLRDFFDVRRVRLESERGVFTGFFMSVDDSEILPPNSNKKIVR